MEFWDFNALNGNTKVFRGDSADWPYQDLPILWESVL